MKKIILLFITLILSSTAFAQEEDTLSMSIDKVLNACIAMQKADARNDSKAMREAADSLRSQTTNFSSLRCRDVDAADASLEGHFVFNENFVDTLIANGEAHAKSNADALTHTTTHRGQSANGAILTKNCFVKAGASTVYTFASRGRQELAVVAEAGGLVTMKIHVTNTAGLDEYHSDTVDVKKGRAYRKTSFDLPTNKRNTVELEVVNCSKKDISFVVISN